MHQENSKEVRVKGVLRKPIFVVLQDIYKYIQIMYRILGGGGPGWPQDAGPAPARAGPPPLGILYTIGCTSICIYPVPQQQLVFLDPFHSNPVINLLI